MKSGMHTQSVPGKNGRSRAMAERHSTIRVTRRYSAPPDRAFDAWLHPAVAGKWLFATASRPILYGLGMTLDSSRDDRDLAGGDTRWTDPLSISRPAERL